jgi:uncharacterized protein
MPSGSPLTRRGFVARAVGAAGAALSGSLPARIGAAGDASVAPGSDEPRGLVRSFPLEQVRLLPGPCREALEANSRYQLSLVPDRLLHTFRLNAGLPSREEPLGGWEKPDVELRGHYTGHYLSSLALLHASTGDAAYCERASTMVEELARCQKAIGNGYLSAFPEELFDRLRSGVKVWAPFYTLHKILAGLLDVYRYCGNAEALATAERLAAWVGNWTKGLSDAHLDRVLLTEFGGMNAALYDLFAISAKQEHADLAHRFDHPAFFAPLSAHRDELTGLHVNTQIPKVIGAARRYELLGEPRYRDIAEFFWNQVTGLRSYCTGGTSNNESWNTPPGVLSKELGATSTECCCAYNLMKLTRHLFTWTADPRAFDYYERTLFNHRLGTQSQGDGGTLYYLPLASGYWKPFSSPESSFWCCTGTAAEEFGKLGDSIYFHDDAGVFVNLFIASELRWPEKGLRLRQETTFPEEEGTRVVVTADRPLELTLRLRIPWWANRGGSVKLNGAPLPSFASPSSYLTLSRTWKTGDTLDLHLPMSVHAAPMPDDASVQAVMYGPLVLAGRLGNEGLTREMIYPDVPWELKGKPAVAPDIVADPREGASWVEAVPGERLRFRAPGQSGALALIPLYQIQNERYAVYWNLRSRAT